MPDLICVNKVDLPVLTYKTKRVITLEVMDQVHERPSGTARRTFARHRARLVEGEDYFVRNSSEAHELGITAPNGLTLLTQSGYLMLVKSFKDELAWTVQRRLVTAYFVSPMDDSLTPKTPGDLLVHMAEAYRDLERRTTQLEAESHAAQTRALLAEATATQAKAAADLALADSRYMSLEEFVIANHLLPQFPVVEWPALARRLGYYCTLYNLSTYKVPVQGKPWPQETVYPLQALGWLVRYPTMRHPVLTFPKRAKKE